MKPFTSCAVLVALLTVFPISTTPRKPVPSSLPEVSRITASFDSDWRFFKGDASGAEGQVFDDTKWRALNLPHDWSIEGPFDEKNPTDGAGGFLPAGVGWYRKHFTLPTDYAGRRAFIEFDGIMANSDVWINGSHLGRRPYGYVSFCYELTGHLNFGNNKVNVLAVRADNSGQPASRWYSGAGIYRHVRLVVTDAVHIRQWGTFVTTPQITTDLATVHVQSTVVNQSGTPREISLQITIISPEGRPVGTTTTKQQTVATGQSVDFQQDVPVKTPRLWDLEHPNLYRAVTKVLAAGAALDDETALFGIR